MTPQQFSQQQRSNAQPSEQNIKHVQHVDEVTSIGHKWQSATPSYYMPKTITHVQLTPIIGYYTFDPIFILNQNVVDLQLERNQFLNRLEQLRKLEQRPSHWSSFQHHVELVEAVVAPIVVQQTQPFHQPI